MRTKNASLRRPLDLILAAPSHVAILRIFIDVGEGLSGREIARRAEINHQTCAIALARLEQKGIVCRIGAGRSQLFSLNRDNIFVKSLLVPAFREERRLFLAIQKNLSRLVAPTCISAILFGSVSRREDTAASDYDLALVVHAKTRKVRATVAELINKGFKQCGLRVSPIVFTKSEFESRLRNKDPLTTSIMRDGIIIYGSHIKEYQAWR